MDNLNIKHILSEEFQNLTEFALKEKKNYLTAKPFPNIALNNFFNNNFLNTILDRPVNEKPFVLLIVGYPDKDCKIPTFAKNKKKLKEISTIF